MQNSEANIGAKIRAGLPALTSLRFFAALAVLLFHFGAGAAASAGAPALVVSVLHSGYLGVTFFFILSGFILTCAYRDRLTDADVWKSYWIARLARIYPVYLLGLLITLPFGEILKTVPSPQTLFLLQSWTLPASRSGIDWNMPAWTLSVELFFYLVFPFALILSSKLNRAWLAAAMAAAGVLIVSLNLSGIAPAARLDGALQYVPLPILRLPEFLFGVAMAQFLLTYADRELPGWASFATVAGAVLIVLLMAAPYHAPGIISMGFAALILFATLSKGFIEKVLSTRALVLLGGASYAVYLFQMGVHAAIDALFPQNQTLSRLIFPVAILSVSAATFVFFEEPLRKYIVSKSRERARTKVPA